MSYQIYDLTRDTTDSTGTGALTLDTMPPDGYQDPAIFTNGSTVDYRIFNSGNTEYETGRGTITGTTLTRDTVRFSSNGNALVELGSGTKNVLIGPGATWFQDMEDMKAAANLSSDLITTVGTITSGVWNGTVIDSAYLSGVLRPTQVFTTADTSAAIKTALEAASNGDWFHFEAGEHVFNSGTVTLSKNIRITGEGWYSGGTDIKASSVTNGLHLFDITGNVVFEDIQLSNQFLVTQDVGALIHLNNTSGISQAVFYGVEFRNNRSGATNSQNIVKHSAGEISELCFHHCHFVNSGALNERPMVHVWDGNGVDTRRVSNLGFYHCRFTNSVLDYCIKVEIVAGSTNGPSNVTIHDCNIENGAGGTLWIEGSRSCNVANIRHGNDGGYTQVNHRFHFKGSGEADTPRADFELSRCQIGGEDSDYAVGIMDIYVESDDGTGAGVIEGCWTRYIDGHTIRIDLNSCSGIKVAYMPSNTSILNGENALVESVATNSYSAPILQTDSINTRTDGTLELLKFVGTGSAVNEFTITNAATGTSPILSATGDDTDIGITLTPKGTGGLTLGSSGLITCINNTDATPTEVLRLSGLRATPTAGDAITQTFYLAGSDGNAAQFAGIKASAETTTFNAKDGSLKLQVMVEDTLKDVVETNVNGVTISLFNAPGRSFRESQLLVQGPGSFSPDAPLMLVNQTASVGNSTLFAVQRQGSNKFTVDNEGDVNFVGSIGLANGAATIAGNNPSQYVGYINGSYNNGAVFYSNNSDPARSKMTLGFGAVSQRNLDSSYDWYDLIIRRDADGQSTYSEAGSLIRLERDMTNVTAENGNYIEMDSVFTFTGAGELLIGSTTASGKLFIDGSSDQIQCLVQGHSVQSTAPNIFVVEKSDGTDLFSVAEANTSVTNSGGLVLIQTSQVDQTSKNGHLAVKHFLNAEEDTLGFQVFSLGTGSSPTISGIDFGGGSGSYNAVSTISFYVAADSVTTSGTKHLQMTNGLITVSDAVDLVFNATTGTKIGTATTQKIAFYNSTPIVQPIALTAALNQITHTEPGTPDYAIQDMTSTSPFGFVTQDEANTALKVIKNLQVRVDELETRLQSLGLVA